MLPNGGQKGHKGHTLNQKDTPDEIIIHKVVTCTNCNKNLKSQAPNRIIKRQIFDIQEPKLYIQEHQAEVKLCSCGCNNTATLPSNAIASAQYGPRVKAMAVYLSNQHLIPSYRITEIFSDIFNLSISESSFYTINEKFCKAVTPYQENILEEIKSSPVKHLDETGFRIGGKTNWLHVVSNGLATHYRASPKRGNLLDGIQGTVVHDHWKPYFTLKNV
jgi:transposase